MTIDQIKKVDWRYVINRREALLFKSITDGSYSSFQELTGINWKANYILRTSDGPLLHSGKEIDLLREIFEKGGSKILKKFSRDLIFNVNKLGRFASGIEKKNCAGLSYTRLNALIKEYTALAFKAHNFLLPMPVADKTIAKMIIGLLPPMPEEKKREYLGVLTSTQKDSPPEKEKIEFQKLLIQCKKISRERSEKLLERHVKRFGYLGARNYWWNQVWTLNSLKERIKNENNKNLADLKAELKYLETLNLARKNGFKKLIKKLGIKSNFEIYKLILMAQEFAYLRTWRTDIIYGSGYWARNLFYEAAKRAGADREVIPYLTIQEVLKMVKTKKLPISASELKNRKEFNASARYKNEYKIFSGKKWEEIFRKISSKDEPWKTGSISGLSAYPGIVKGRVVIVLQGEDGLLSINKIKRGDIMVATMTFPNFIPAMEKAAAFVTDEGGILCHAAIVAREMKKPCIIGTKNATQVLRDGDLVEVDADKGVVRKING